MRQSTKQTIAAVLYLSLHCGTTAFGLVTTAILTTGAVSAALTVPSLTTTTALELTLFGGFCLAAGCITYMSGSVTRDAIQQTTLPAT